MAKLWQKVIDLDTSIYKLLYVMNYCVHGNCIYISYSGGILYEKIT